MEPRLSRPKVHLLLAQQREPQLPRHLPQRLVAMCITPTAPQLVLQAQHRFTRGSRVIALHLMETKTASHVSKEWLHMALFPSVGFAAWSDLNSLLRNC